nr:response regulator [Lautropia sp.]
DLTGNVNLLAANLTNQVRAIAEVATAVTKGDLTRSIQVEARGEVAELKNNINTMIDNLRGTTERNQEQDWLKTNLAKFSSMLQGQRDLVTVGKSLLSELAPLVNAQQGAVYQVHSVDASAAPEAPGMQLLRLLAGYALPASQPQTLQLGEGLVGQCAIEQTSVLLADVPASHTRIRSSLADAPAANILVLPLIFEGQTKAVIELASLRPFTQMHMTFLEQLTESIGVVLNTIEATMRTEHLLEQSQQLTIELQTRQTQLQSTNQELASKAQQLAAQNVEVERKNMEVEQARHALEEKAAELALTSKYKSEFLANMSHELRTPLNSILILGQQLAENNARNLSAKQVEFARNIHSAGTDLLTLINDILDLSKIESGTVSVDAQEIRFSSIRDSVQRMFQHLAESKNLQLDIDIDETLPGTFTSDFTRLQQILKNLLSNAFKFTAKGRVSVSVRRIADGAHDFHLLRAAPLAVAFEVSDSGIGIAPEKQKMIFEAFQQADAGTSRKYGGTGLGLAISRELATLLGGEIRLVSKPGEGSTFTLYLPLVYRGPANVPLVAGHILPAGMSAGLNAGYGRPALSVVRSSAQEAAASETVLEDERGVHDAVLLDSGYAGFRGDAGYGGYGSSNGWNGADGGEAGDDGLPVYEEDPEKTRALQGRVVLVVDDDARNIFALTTLLENYAINVLSATNGRQAIEIIQSTPGLDAVLMDIMMPDMDGYETIREIRSSPALSDLPIVALTAKAMKGDRQKCMEAGASDYIAKPIRSGQLLSLLRARLCR